MAKQLNVSLNVDANTGQAKQALLDLQNSLTQLQNNSTKLNLGLNPAEIRQASNAIIDLQAHLKAATNINTGGLDFSKLDASLKASKMSITDYGRQLLNLGPQGQQAFQQLTAAVAASEVPVKRVSALFGEFGTVIKNTIRWQASSSLIHGFMGAIQQSFRYAQDLNKSLTDIQIVTQASDDHMANFAEQANKAALRPQSQRLQPREIHPIRPAHASPPCSKCSADSRLPSRTGKCAEWGFLHPQTRMQPRQQSRPTESTFCDRILSLP